MRQQCLSACASFGALLSALALSFSLHAAPDDRGAVKELADEYIDAWREFYPAQAFAYGDVESAANFADYSDQNLKRWHSANRQVLTTAKALLAGDASDVEMRTDLRVLVGKAEDELAAWEEDSPLTQQPQWYAEQVSQALTHLLVRDQLSAQARSDALAARLDGVARLCRFAVEMLEGGTVLRSERALRTLAGARKFYSEQLSGLVTDWPATSSGDRVAGRIPAAVAAIAALETHIREEILPSADARVGIGAEVYAAKLSRLTGGLYTPERLLKDAGREVREVRALMIAESRRWRDSEGSDGPDADGEALLALALEAMESDRQDNSADFLESFTTLTFAAEDFIQANAIATVPKPTTLEVALSPAHFSGAAVGGVYPSGVFDPQADTLFYVPSIPDDAPMEAKEGFYRSFNTHFNTMIMSHEMFPGHYLQYKVAVTTAPRVRAVFPNGSYTEGWGTFSEELMLDAGWADNAPLTRLAHLRKRLENATRAYVSVQVNTAGWDEQEVFEFARDEGLLAPQFARNLWQRVVNSPLQITNYMTGYLHFKRLYDGYRANRADAANRPWVDAVLRAGPLPMALLESVLEPMLAQ